MAFDLTPINVKDSSGDPKPMIAYNDGTNSAFAKASLNSSGAIINPATSDLQTTANSALATIASQTSGLATAAAQTTGNSSLATVATNTGTVSTNLGAAADAAASSDTGTFSAIALLKRGLQNWTTLLARIPALVSGRVPVDGSGVTQPVSASALPLPSGAATSANQTTTNTKLDSVITNTTGLATAANQSSANTKLDTVIANTGAGSVCLTNTPTVTAGAYTSGMVVGGKQSLANAVRSSGGSGIIQSVSVSKKTALTAPYDVYFFHTDPTNSTFTDNSALALNVADLPYLIGVAHCTDLVDNGTPKTLQANNLAIPFKLATGTTLYAVAVIRGAETLASTSAIVMNVGILQD